MKTNPTDLRIKKAVTEIIKRYEKTGELSYLETHVTIGKCINDIIDNCKIPTQ